MTTFSQAKDRKFVVVVFFFFFFFFIFLFIIIEYGPFHEIMVLFVLHKLILQTRMCCRPVGLDDWVLVGPFVYFHTSCVQTAMALARLRGCEGYPSEPSLVAYVISTIIWGAGSYIKYIRWSSLYRGFYMSAHVLLNALNEFGNKIRCEALPIILSVFPQRIC